MKEKWTTVIDITESCIKIYQCSADRKMSFAGVLSVNGLAEEEISKQLQNYMRAQHIRADGHAVIGILPKRFSTFRYYTLPSQDKAELAQMIQLQITSQLPYSASEVFIENIILGKTMEGSSQILSVIVPTEVVERYMKILQKASLTPKILTLSTFALFAWYRSLPAREKSPGTLTDFIINSDHYSTEICCCSGDSIVYSRAFNVHSEEQSADLMRQIDLTIQTYKKEQPGRDLGKIFLMSSNDSVQRLKSLLDGLYCPVTIYNPTLQMADKVRFPQDIAHTAGIGVCTCNRNEIVNLLPKSKASLSTSDLRRIIVRTGIAVALAVTLSVFALASRLIQKEQYLQSLQRQEGEIEAEVKRRAGAGQMLSNVPVPRPPLVSIIQNVYGNLPFGVYLSILRISESDLILEGVAPYESLQAISSKFSASSIFQNVVFEQTGDIGGKASFRLTAKIRPAS